MNVKMGTVPFLGQEEQVSWKKGAGKRGQATFCPKKLPVPFFLGQKVACPLF